MKLKIYSFLFFMLLFTWNGKIYATNKDIITLESPIPTSLNICIEGNKRIEISFIDGKITFVNLTLDEASKKFWESVSNYYPDFKKAIIDEYENKKAKKFKLKEEKK